MRYGFNVKKPPLTIIISGALLSSPGNLLNKINDIVPIDNWIEEEALKSTLKLKANEHLIHPYAFGQYQR